MLADYHVHTIFSDDSECPMQEMVDKAISLGIDEIVFTDHVDYGVRTDLNCDYSRYFPQIEELKKQYNGRIVIRKGIEFGMQIHTIPICQQDFDQYDFDFVILSNHQIGDKEFWNQNYQAGKNQDEINLNYYEAIYDVIRKYKDYSVLGHLDMIKRYDLYGEYPDSKIMGVVTKILQQVISDGKGIEVNTSSFRYGLPDLTPSTEILKKYLELGGTIITIGSDAHNTEQLGAHFEEVKNRLKEIGFQQFCTFEKMKPIYHKL